MKDKKLPTLEELQRRNREDPLALSFAELDLMHKLAAEQQATPVKYTPMPEGLRPVFTGGFSELRDVTKTEPSASEQGDGEDESDE